MSARNLFTALSTLIIGVSVAGVAGAAEKAAWPQPIIDRPLTLPEGSVSVGTGFSSDTEFAAPELSIGGLWGASYGITNDLSVGVSYDMGLKGDNAGKGSFGLGGGYTYYAEGALILTANAGFSYDTVANEAGDLSIGSWVWFNAMPWLAIISPGLTDPNAVAVALPVGVGFQASPELFVQVDTTLATFSLEENGVNTFIGADVTPLDLTVYFSPTNQWDISAGAGVVAMEGVDIGDTASIGAGVTYYGNVD